MFEFTDKKSAVALVKYERDRNRVVYAEYIASNKVTLDNVADHVQALAGLAFPKFDHKTADEDAKRERKAFCTRIRNGLNYRLGKTSKRAETAAPEQGAGDGAETPESGAEGVEVTPTPATTADIAATAEQAVALLIERANAGDSEAMSAVNRIQAATFAPDTRAIVDGSRVAA